MARSITVRDGEQIPSWARYAVVFCTGPHGTNADTIQCFSDRATCERFTLQASRYFPPRAGDALTMWALVYALPAIRNGAGYWGIRGGQCYLAIDPGQAVLKRHEIDPFYGHPAHTKRVTSCACCPDGGW